MMAHPLNRLLSRFANLKSEIRHGALRDAHFRALCEDYEAAAAALEFWTNSADRRRSERQREYLELIARLEDEIVARCRNKQ